MPTAQETMAAAHRYLNRYEEPPGSNRVPGITDYVAWWAGLSDSQRQWCDMYCSVVFASVGIDNISASCWTSIRLYQDGTFGTWVGKPDISGIRVGDQGFGGSGGADHTWLVDAVDINNRSILCCEGNWGNRSLAQWRDYDDPWIYGFGRPNYDVGQIVDAPPVAPPLPGNDGLDFSVFRPSLNWYVRPRLMSGDTIKITQLFFNQVAGRNLKEDGVYGKNTADAVHDFQEFFGLTADRIVGSVTATVMHNVAVDKGWSPF